MTESTNTPTTPTDISSTKLSEMASSHAQSDTPKSTFFSLKLNAAQIVIAGESPAEFNDLVKSRDGVLAA